MSGVAAAFTRKLGPLPAGVWLAGGAVLLYLLRRVRSRSTGTTTAATGGVAASGSPLGYGSYTGIGSGDGGDGGGGDMQPTDQTLTDPNLTGSGTPVVYDPLGGTASDGGAATTATGNTVPASGTTSSGLDPEVVLRPRTQRGQPSTVGANAPGGDNNDFAGRTRFGVTKTHGRVSAGVGARRPVSTRGQATAGKKVRRKHEPAPHAPEHPTSRAHTDTVAPSRQQTATRPAVSRPREPAVTHTDAGARVQQPAPPVAKAAQLAQTEAKAVPHVAQPAPRRPAAPVRVPKGRQA